MEYELGNNKVRVIVRKKGAEITSITMDGKEYMWNADPTYWGRTAPVLFPFVGKLFRNEYRYEGKKYVMGQHGFARDMEFDLIKQNAAELILGITDTPQTLECYPFHFRLEISYCLIGDCLKVGWHVKNTGKKKLYFSIGGHPGFFCPMEGKGSYTECYLLFQKNKKPVEHLISSVAGANGLTEEIREYEAKNGILPIDRHLFDRDALILENRQVDEIALLTSQKQSYISLSFDTPLVAVWSPPKMDAPFVCIEPWCGRCDRESFQGQLSDREWSNHLEPGECFERYYTISL